MLLVGEYRSGDQIDRGDARQEDSRLVADPLTKVMGNASDSMQALYRCARLLNDGLDLLEHFVSCC